MDIETSGFKNPMYGDMVSISPEKIFNTNDVFTNMTPNYLTARKAAELLGYEYIEYGRIIYPIDDTSMRSTMIDKLSLLCYQDQSQTVVKPSVDKIKTWVDDKELIYIKALIYNPRALNYIPKKHKLYPEYVKLAYEIHGTRLFEHFKELREKFNGVVRYANILSEAVALVGTEQVEHPITCSNRAFDFLEKYPDIFKEEDLEFPLETVNRFCVSNVMHTIENVPVTLLTEDLGIRAVLRSIGALGRIPYNAQTELMCLLSVLKCGVNLQDVATKYKTEEVCLAAVKNSESALRYIPNPTDEMKMIAIKKYGPALNYICEPTDEMILTAMANTASGRLSMFY